MTCRRSSTPSPELLQRHRRRAILSHVEEYRLEPARIADAPLLANMSQQFVESGLKPAWGAVRIGWHIRDADSVVLTARGGDRITGFAIMRFADESAHLNLLAVAPAQRRQGVARALLGWLEQTALTAGTFKIGLELRAGNTAARAFYARLGYQECGEVPGYYQGVETAIRLTRDVRASRETPGTREPSA
jgi:ribosomal protein S18 acetylase RimI-like enzyme